MIKKLFLGIAIGATLLTSCSSEEPAVSNTADGNVTFTATLPANLMNRAYGDGTTATQLTYAVYNADGQEIETYTKTVTLQGLKATVNLKLVPEQQYTVVFWAQAPDAPYTLDTSTGTVTVNPAGNSQDETRDAFFAAETFVVKNAVSKTVELKRPFAQINIGTNDLTEFKAAKGEITKTGMKLVAADKLNLKDGTVSGNANYDLALAPLPDEEFPMASAPADMTYLVANYILVGNTKETIDITWTSDNTLATNKDVTYTAVPIQRNYRTNIYGNLLTNAYTYNVTIVPDFIEPAHDHEIVQVASPEEFVSALQSNDGVIIPKNVTIDLTQQLPLGVDDESLQITSPKTIIVEGELKCDNGAQIQVHSDLKLIGINTAEISRKSRAEATEIQGGVITGGPRGLFYIIEGGSLTAENITFNTPEAYRGADIWNQGGGDLTITNCTFNSQMGSIFFEPASDDATFTMENCTVNNTSRNGLKNPQGQSVWAYAIRTYAGTANLRNNNCTGIQGVLSAAGTSVLNVYSGTYATHNSPGKSDAFYAIYTCTDGSCNVYGGNFSSPRVAVYNGNNDTTDIFGHMYLYGGRYSSIGWDQEINDNLKLPEGYIWKAIENDPIYKYEVVKSTD